MATILRFPKVPAAVLGANLACAAAYGWVVRPWLALRYAHRSGVHPILQFVVLEGDDRLRIADTQAVTLALAEILVLVLVGTALVAAGRWGDPGRVKRRSVALLAFTVLLAFLAGEASMRVYHRLTVKVPLLLPLDAAYDARLGWKGRRFTPPAQDPAGPRILIVGDSFTHGLSLDSGSVYAAVLARSTGARVFAYGGGGYGTLQEYLVLDGMLAEARPDLIVIQACSNDFINNYFPLEQASYTNNNLMLRPYWEHGAVRYRFPRPFGSLRMFATAHSRLAYELFRRIELTKNRLMSRGLLPCVEGELEAGRQAAAFAESQRTTSEILALFRRRAGSTPVAMFVSDVREPERSAFRRLCQENGIVFLRGINRALSVATKQGQDVHYPDGAHWSVLGHQVVGLALARELLRLGYLGDSRPPPS